MHGNRNILLAVLVSLVVVVSVLIARVNPRLLSPALMLMDLASRPAETTASDHRASPAPETAPTPSPAPLAIDYAELIRYAETYDGQWVQIAGRIGHVEGERLDIFDRISYYVAEEGNATSTFQIYLDKKTAAPCTEGEYYVIEGLWKIGYRGPYLSEAVILDSGATAKAKAMQYQEDWEAERLQRAESTPLTDYLELWEQRDQYEGSYVRTAVQIGRVKNYKIDVHTKYWFDVRNERNGEDIGTVDLEGCMPEVLALCQDGGAVIVGGKLVGTRERFSVKDCYIEAAGETAQAEVDAFVAQHKADYAQRKQEYIAGCTPLDYRTVLRYPTEFREAQLSCTGTVVELSRGNPISASFILLLDGESDNRVEVYYSSGAIGDPNIVLGDSVAAYGYVFDVYYPKNEEGVSKEALPDFRAMYLDYGE
ncbi:hypothetical protein [Intestinimonas butyriciproducens]|uniref:Uncharacterized protein n=1 Tax=Intestinimonas butyriciproducens TaxID=1297617 RepID=A0A2U1CDK8_9FIRM|nr:hypothetical protein [Intestinimonas butyriciproducens]SCJ31272.1 Uncharacterised protein [uncultured Clostridium sp.]MBU5230276.1 hypothetical protein [Intestinimonas butyriciproducens]MCI6363642.1 hypothetical protein [Intestinimonas butyriciproducens]MCR1905951.1 hypothetical protein [Intestinimonas butyriciproducens]MDB7816957.1 hypothetical protein [Intestinimonas butyriciproducens]